MARILTDAAINKINPRKRKELSDLVRPGLTIRITRRSRTWTFVWKPAGEGPISPITGKPMAGRQQRITLGTYPAVGITEARERARQLAVAVSEGKDPRDATATDRTFGALATAFIAHKEKTVRLNSALAIRNSLEKHVVPRWGKLPYESIDRRALNLLSEQVTAEVGKSTGETARKWAKSVFTWAVDRGLVDSHPLAGVARKPREKEQAGRVLSDSDIRAVWQASHDVPIIRLLMLTGCRRSEWADAAWSEINREDRTLVIPAKRYKTGVTFELPLVPIVWSIVESLPEVNEYLFGGSDPVDAALDKVRARTPDVAHWSPHDLRRTCQTRLAKMGLHPDVYEAVLGHVKSGMKKHYNYHEYSTEKRDALERYAAHVIAIAG